jgi:hypothetical protein
MNAAAEGPESAADGYRPVSRLAVTALGLGICSAAALLHPLCWAVPLAAGAVSVAALADVRRNGRAGGLAALAGLALAAGFGGQAVGHAGVRRLLAERRACAATSVWLDAVREERRADAAAMMGGNAGADAAATGAVLEAIRGCGPTAAVVAMQGSPDGAEADAWVVTLRLRPCGDAGEREVEVRLGVETLPARGAERWRVTDVAVVR